jgi:hypothetical protein
MIDILDNGNGLPRDAAARFFDLANSNKCDSSFRPIPGKVGYKGHGSKIFFNADKVTVTSRTDSDEWSVTLENPIDQIQRTGEVVYSDFITTAKSGLQLPQNWPHGFYIRIEGHRHFRTQYTKFKLNHLNIRDYSRWFTVFGSIRNLENNTAKEDRKLLLHALDWNGFRSKVVGQPNIDPMPVTEEFDGELYERIPFGHYVPPERSTDREMKSYAAKIGSSRPYYEFYSKTIHNSQESCSDGTTFHLFLHLEGYETKRLYDPLLTGRGKTRTDISHSDTERYGLWACKGGVPVEKVDTWLEGKGGYSFLHAFVDCDDFDLTANRGSIQNSDIEKLSIVRKKLGEIFMSAHIQKMIAQRTEMERMEQQLLSGETLQGGTTTEEDHSAG